jgi:membrane-associated protein
LNAHAAVTGCSNACIQAQFQHRFRNIERSAKDNLRPMDILSFLVDFALHIDKHLEAFVIAYGHWVYGLLFLIVFVETGVVVMPFLPGDSLIFIVGALCGVGHMSFPVSCAVLIAAAILGDQSNFTIGRFFGPKVFQWEDSRLFNRKAFDRAHAFYERYGGVTVILARFMPFIRTFAPFVAGVADMSRGRFTLFNVVGALIWVLGVAAAGYFFGNLAVVREHLELIIWGLIFVPGLVAIFGAWRAGKAERREVAP